MAYEGDADEQHHSKFDGTSSKVGVTEPLSCLISTHPYWAERGWSLVGRVELFLASGSGPDGVRELVVRWNGEDFVVTGPEAQP
ncbi:hypothetical protein ACFU98_30900 [Streptomyces sp. NPDC057575]|uniref:hypothetical protein n=1 Tax=unclassified Streptomyces TaxID=2593676 RepID=UPI0036ACFDBD